MKISDVPRNRIPVEEGLRHPGRSTLPVCSRPGPRNRIPVEEGLRHVVAGGGGAVSASPKPYSSRRRVKTQLPLATGNPNLAPKPYSSRRRVKTLASSTVRQGLPPRNRIPVEEGLRPPLATGNPNLVPRNRIPVEEGLRLNFSAAK